MDEQYIKTLTETSERAKSNTHMIEDLKTELKEARDELRGDIRELKEENKALTKMATSIELMAQDFVHLKDDVGEMKTCQHEMNQKQTEMKEEISEIKSVGEKTKAESYDKIKGMIVTAIVSGVAAFVLGAICPAIFGK